MRASAFFEQNAAVECPSLPARPVWHLQAACRGVGPEVFFGVRGHIDYRQAAALCAVCPVRAECDAEGETLPSALRNYGYRAGLDAHDRLMRRRRVRLAALATR